MRRTALVLVSATLIVVSQPVIGGGLIDDGSIVATATSTTVAEVEPVVEEPVRCVWGADAVYGEAGYHRHDENKFLFTDSRMWRISRVTGEVWVRAHQNCFRGDVLVSTGLGWRRVVAPDPRVLGESLYDEVVEQVPEPVPALSPVGPGFVNLGMWLAVVEPERVSVTARAGSVWATTSAELVSTRFEMGDESVVVCDGAGDPIPVSALGSVEASPVCGHTYRGVNGGVPFEVTVTSTWRVWWVGSGGAGGELGTLDREAELDYEVREIQTVGG